MYLNAERLDVWLMHFLLTFLFIELGCKLSVLSHTVWSSLTWQYIYVATTGETVRSLPLVAVSTPSVFIYYVRGGSYSRRKCESLLFYGALVTKHDTINISILTVLQLYTYIYRTCGLCWQFMYSEADEVHISIKFNVMYVVFAVSTNKLIVINVWCIQIVT